MTFYTLPGTGLFVLVLFAVLVVLVAQLYSLRSRGRATQRQLARLDRCCGQLSENAIYKNEMKHYVDDVVSGAVGGMPARVNALSEHLARLEHTAKGTRAAHSALVEHLDVELTEPVPGPTLVYVKRKPVKAPRRRGVRR